MKDNKMVQSNNAFVRSEQAKMKKMMGNRPGCPPEMKKFDAFMSNNGETAQESARKLTKGLDDAFPVK
ncbi:TPA: hypothetical protein ACPSKZ_000680 [Legionella anisa]|uniref:hypothetical protein n=1 Tax=Legionella anisa TaxID=28082 RepID=UPI002243D322|nr:hypothetical protein [Legionella anisa]MCW8425622.1 hypothetical protein [Legionella anisa]MCW8448949.1 hypothetical protein [Legionella anisa]